MVKALEKYLRPGTFTTPFCPGCGHGIILGAVLRAIEALGIDMKEMLFISGIGCASWIPNPHYNADALHTLHGRALAFATGAKLFNPKLKVMVISGDGDLFSIGGNHFIHAARRNLDVTVICANNWIYGMTGGQVASTTPKGGLSSTTPKGNPYPPFDLCKLAEAAGSGYIARYSVLQVISLIEAIKEGLNYSGFSFLEVISPCPIQYGRRNQLDSPSEMIEFLKKICISKEEAAKLTPLELEGKIVTGKLKEGKK